MDRTELLPPDPARPGAHLIRPPSPAGPHVKRKPRRALWRPEPRTWDLDGRDGPMQLSAAVAAAAGWRYVGPDDTPTEPHGPSSRPR